MINALTQENFDALWFELYSIKDTKTFKTLTALPGLTAYDVIKIERKFSVTALEKIPRWDAYDGVTGALYFSIQKRSNFGLYGGLLLTIKWEELTYTQEIELGYKQKLDKYVFENWLGWLYNMQHEFDALQSKTQTFALKPYAKVKIDTLKLKTTDPAKLVTALTPKLKLTLKPFRAAALLNNKQDALPLQKLPKIKKAKQKKIQNFTQFSNFTVMINNVVIPVYMYPEDYESQGSTPSVWQIPNTKLKEAVTTNNFKAAWFEENETTGELENIIWIDKQDNIYKIPFEQTNMQESANFADLAKVESMLNNVLALGFS